MKVVLGSKNPDKIKILKRAFKEIHLSTEIVGVEVNSQITDQPLDKETTKKGALNHARNAKKKNLKADFWVGLEGGLHDYGEGYHLVTYAVLIDKSGDEFVGQGEEIHLPEEVSEGVKNGEWFGKVVREYAQDHEIDKNLITRLTPFTQAVQNAYVEYLKVHDNLDYREKSAAVIIDEENNFLIVQLHGYGEDDWNFSGGGIEKGETSKQAVLREIFEELGTDKFQVLKKSKYKEQYDWPNWLIARDLREKPSVYRGQEVNYFLVKFLGKRKDIKPDPKEIKKIKWVKYEDLKDHFNFHNQMKSAKKLLKEFGLAS